MFNVHLIFIVHLQLWDDKMVRRISSHPAIQRVVTLGTLCALELKAEGTSAGYKFVNFILSPLLYFCAPHALEFLCWKNLMNIICVI